jgi:hypothetical protein
MKNVGAAVGNFGKVYGFEKALKCMENYLCKLVVTLHPVRVISRKLLFELQFQDSL